MSLWKLVTAASRSNRSRTGGRNRSGAAGGSTGRAAAIAAAVTEQTGTAATGSGGSTALGGRSTASRTCIAALRGFAALGRLGSTAFHLTMAAGGSGWGTAAGDGSTATNFRTATGLTEPSGVQICDGGTDEQQSSSQRHPLHCNILLKIDLSSGSGV